jgi:hypothetical protein
VRNAAGRGFLLFSRRTVVWLRREPRAKKAKNTPKKKAAKKATKKAAKKKRR